MEAKTLKRMHRDLGNRIEELLAVHRYLGNEIRDDDLGLALDYARELKEDFQSTQEEYLFPLVRKIKATEA